MIRPPQYARARAIALPRPQVAMRLEWLATAIAVALLLAGLLAS